MLGRYMAEISDDMDRTRATTAAKAAYEAGCTLCHNLQQQRQHPLGCSEDGTKVAETSLKVTSPFRLGLAGF